MTKRTTTILSCCLYGIALFSLYCGIILKISTWHYKKAINHTNSEINYLLKEALYKNPLFRDSADAEHILAGKEEAKSKKVKLLIPKFLR